jgi:carboxylesterase type B
LNQMLQAYPDDPSIGSPYNTVGAAPSDRFYGPTNQFKVSVPSIDDDEVASDHLLISQQRAASIYGDIRYQSNRRLWLSAMGDNAKVYSYLYAQQSPTGSPALGVPHGSDLSAVLQAPPNPVSEIMARQFLAFAITQDPSSSSGRE